MCSSHVPMRPLFCALRASSSQAVSVCNGTFTIIIIGIAFAIVIGVLVVVVGVIVLVVVVFSIAAECWWRRAVPGLGNASWTTQGSGAVPVFIMSGITRQQEKLIIA